MNASNLFPSSPLPHLDAETKKSRRPSCNQKKNILLVPVSNILLEEDLENSTNAPLSKEKLLFCYRTMMKALESLKDRRYSDFDPHTVSNCCHGMAFYTTSLIASVLNLDFLDLLQEGEQAIERLKNFTLLPPLECFWQAPPELIHLARLYIISFIKEITPEKLLKTVTSKLKQLSPVGSSFCRDLSKSIQGFYSNFIAKRYAFLFDRIKNDFFINGLSIKLWGRYVSCEHLRKDKKGTLYASNLFSMQTLLAYAIYSKSKIAVVTDFFDPNDQNKGKHLCILLGDGKNKMKLQTSEEISSFPPDEPVMVFGACAYSNTLDLSQLDSHLRPWLTEFPSLVLACDVFYPQFPKAGNDPEFDSQPITPKEPELQELLSRFASFKGFSSEDPSLFCLTHIYSASIEQLTNVLTKKNLTDLPTSFIFKTKKAEQLNPVDSS